MSTGGRVIQETDEGLESYLYDKGTFKKTAAFPRPDKLLQMDDRDLKVLNDTYLWTVYGHAITLIRFDINQDGSLQAVPTELQQYRKERIYMRGYSSTIGPLCQLGWQKLPLLLIAPETNTTFQTTRTKEGWFLITNAIDVEGKILVQSQYGYKEPALDVFDLKGECN